MAGGMERSYANALFDREPAGVFAQGHIFMSEPDLATAKQDPANGYWHCDIADHETLTWSEKVYELFGVTAGSPINRDEAVGRYTDRSKSALEHVRKFALSRGFGFILDAELRSDGQDNRWIRVLAVPIYENGRPVGLHGVKRALQLSKP